MTPEEFRAAGHAVVDWVADYRQRVPQHPVRAQVAPGDVTAALPVDPPTGTDTIADLLDDLDRVIVPGLTQVQHPRHFGWFPSNACLASVLGDLTSSGLGALGLSWESAPALTELEEVVCDWLRRLTGLDDGWHGSIQDTASTGTLVALLAAREQASDHAAERGGLQAAPQALVVYTSTQAHSSVPKAAALAGFGRDNLRLIDVDPVSYALDPQELAAAMAGDVAAGRRPAAVVLTVGTTSVTAVDPITAVLPIAAEHGAWVHVDAAMAGSALLLPECRRLVDGIGGSPGAFPAADSFGWNPHKWMGTVLDCSLLYVRDPAQLVRVMSSSASYLRSGADGGVTQYRDWGIPLGRRFRALKLWFHLRLDGVDAIRERLRRDLANAAWLAEQVEAEPDWRLVAPCTLQTVCLRHEPIGPDGERLAGAALDVHTLGWVRAVNDSGAAYLTAAELDGRWMVRVSIGVEATQRHDVAAVWNLIRRTASGPA